MVVSKDPRCALSTFNIKGYIYRKATMHGEIISGAYLCDERADGKRNVRQVLRASDIYVADFSFIFAGNARRPKRRKHDVVCFLAKSFVATPTRSRL